MSSAKINDSLIRRNMKGLVFLCIFICSGEAGFLWKKFNEVGDKVWNEVNDKLEESIIPINMVYTNSCIADLGCFPTGPPFFHPIQRPLSLSPTPKVDRIHFYLYTSPNPDLQYYLRPDAESIQNSIFDPTLDTKIVIHGFLVKLIPGHVIYQMKDAIIASGEYNVIVVDWNELNGPPYSQAVANTRVVGAKLAKLIHSLMEETGATPESFHLIGHSLGGQTAGYAGERISNLGRITGLDPAGPYFRYVDPEVRLDPTDALFVDVIHTDGAEFILTGFGTSPPIGHMDFYPNGGRMQPGCAYTSESDNIIGSAINFTSKFLDNSCDHSRAIDYFLESVNNSACMFLSVHCDSYKDFESGKCPPEDNLVAEMGFHASQVEGLELPARFYLRTHGKEPFCNQDSIRIDNDETSSESS